MHRWIGLQVENRSLYAISLKVRGTIRPNSNNQVKFPTRKISACGKVSPLRCFVAKQLKFRIS